MVFSSVSTTIFDTFNCKTFGDDETEYMMSDQSIDCGTHKHKMYQVFAAFMMAVYPVGIPALYFVLLFKARQQLQAEKRDEDESLQKIAFLWDMYEPEMWWFEVFDCVRRLSLTGLLVFVFKGQASQIVVAMVLAVLSVTAFINWKPFIKAENDTLAIVSQLSIFFTLFAGLLKKMDVDKLDSYDQDVFGWLLNFVNCIGIAMVILGWVVKPITRFIRKLGQMHVHNAPLKGIGEDHVEWSAFDAYCRELLTSDEFTAGWETMDAGDWSIGKKDITEEWFAKTKVVGEWRCGNGDGPIDQCRITFEVGHRMEDVYEYLTGFKPPTGTTVEHVQEQTNGDGTLGIYFAVKMPWPMKVRDFKFRRSAQIHEQDALILSKSIVDTDTGLKKTATLGRVRAHLSMGGYYLQRVDNDRTKVTHVVEVHLGGVMVLDVLARRAAGPRMKGIVDDLNCLGEDEEEDEERGRGSSLWRIGSRWLRAVSSGVELGGGQKRRNNPNAPGEPPSPAGPAPTYDNSIFKNGAAMEYEMRTLSSNPMHEEGKKLEKNKEGDNRHVLRAASGGYHKKPNWENKGGKGEKKEKFGL